ncbi:MAG: DNA repair protein RecN [Spirochaetales bacterium]|uniref:DNA repair protein RecN n=1 Tax=Candidatus Thalassospirochaeta sargassi TaxID=3119039 RepID=A0AAJ1MM28_9SPIO|nr:DNA repair protein RecN [Spirochaetales bacterium]
MLEELFIKNYALADQLTVEFQEGFNILSGETGSGKSVIIGALGLVLGEKGDVSAIRTGASETEVSAVINVEGNAEALKWLEEHEISADEGRVIIRRIMKNTGRGSMFIQSVPSVKADVSEFTSLLFDIHGQHEHQSLLSTDNHRKLLDSFAGLRPSAERLKSDFLELNNIKKEYQGLMSDEREMLREADLAAFAVKEIEDAALKPGEIEELETEHKLLTQSEKLFILFEELHRALSESSGGALDGLRSGMENLKELSGIDSAFAEASSRLENAFYETEDVLDGIERYKVNFDFSPERLAACEERLSELLKLRKKYGDSVEDILTFQEESRKKVSSIENREELKAEYAEKIAALEKSVLQQASDLSAKRKSAARKLQTAIQQQLKALGMPKAEFRVQVEAKLGENGRPSCGINGFDAIEFLISPNQGEPPKRLRSIASGGEISRVMLAIKSVLASIDTVDTLVFDEIDAGIGGEIAVAVGEHMYRLSRFKQILCITHLASIAVRADNHIRVCKKTARDRTFTEIDNVAGDERKIEIARMLSGDTDTDVSLKHAEELLVKAAGEREGS